MVRVMVLASLLCATQAVARHKIGTSPVAGQNASTEQPRQKTKAYPQVVSMTYPGLDGLRGQVNGVPKKWRGCTGIVFTYKQSCTLTAGHCLGWMLGPNNYNPRASDEVLKGIQFRNVNGQVSKIDASDLKKNVAFNPRDTDSNEKDPTFKDIESTALDLAVVKLDKPVAGFSFDEVVPTKTDSLSVSKKASVVGSGAHAKFDAITLEGKTQWPFPNQFEQELYTSKQEYVGEASELDKNTVSRYMLETDPLLLKPTDEAGVTKQVQYNVDKQNKKWKLMTEEERSAAIADGNDWRKSWSELSEESRKMMIRKTMEENQAFNAAYPQMIDAFANKLKTKNYGLFFSKASPQEIGFGDSGAPLFLKGKDGKEEIHGVTVMGNDREWNYTGFASITHPKQRDWIKARLIEMECMPPRPQADLKQEREMMKKGF